MTEQKAKARDDLVAFYNGSEYEQDSVRHVPKVCMVRDCAQEASYWIGITLHTGVPNTLYLCTDHMCEVEEKDDEGDGTGFYLHASIAFDGGEAEIKREEIGVYACAEGCEVCA